MPVAPEAEYSRFQRDDAAEGRCCSNRLASDPTCEYDTASVSSPCATRGSRFYFLWLYSQPRSRAYSSPHTVAHSHQAAAPTSTGLFEGKLLFAQVFSERCPKVYVTSRVLSTSLLWRAFTRPSGNYAAASAARDL
ncbi:hypothetical protein MRX96_027840 [Rhipicephalus microplus]